MFRIFLIRTCLLGQRAVGGDTIDRRCVAIGLIIVFARFDVGMGVEHSSERQRRPGGRVR